MGNYHVRFCSGSGAGDRPTDPQRSRQRAARFARSALRLTRKSLGGLASLESQAKPEAK